MINTEGLIEAIKKAIEGKTITQAAKDLGVTRAHLNNILTGRQRPSLHLIDHMAQAFGWEVSVTVRPAGENYKPAELLGYAKVIKEAVYELEQGIKSI